MVGLVGLQDRVAGAVTATGTAHGLREELVRPLGGALVGQVERHIRRTRRRPG